MAKLKSGGAMGQDDEPSGVRLLTDEDVNVLVLGAQIRRDHERIADALERIEDLLRNSFLSKLGDVLVQSMGTFCQTVGGHKAAILVMILIPLLWMMAGSGLYLTLGDLLQIGPAGRGN